MKLYYLFLLIMFFLMSCERTENVSEARKIGAIPGAYINEYTIDGHDYIEKIMEWLILAPVKNVSKKETVLII